MLKEICEYLQEDPKDALNKLINLGGFPEPYLKNTVAVSLLRELYFIEDTSGSQVALHYLRDKEKREVDFLCY